MRSKEGAPLPFEEEVRRIVAEGGKVLRVFTKDGKWNAHHRVLVTKKGHVLFPDHGMCSPIALLTERRLARNTFTDREDCCYVLAEYVSKPPEMTVKHIVDVPIPTMYGIKGRSSAVERYWPEESWHFLLTISQKRNDRRANMRQRLNPSVVGIPFKESVSDRITPFITALRDKVERVRRRRYLKLTS